MSGVSKATLHSYEVREAKTWARFGWTVQGTWNQAIYIGPGRLITKPKDFFGAFDNIAVHPIGRVAFVQVTATPFAKSNQPGAGADRNAQHGEPPFAFCPNFVRTVESWMENPLPEDLVGNLATVIVSYADARHPERRWWTRKSVD